MKISLSKENFTKFSIAFFMVTFIGMYYGEYLHFVWIGYMLMAAAVLFNYNSHKLCGRFGWQYIGYTVIFLLWGYVSFLWTYDEAVSASYLSQTVKVAALAILLTLLLNNLERVKFSLLWFCIGCIIFALLYLNHVDIATLAAGRIRAESISGNSLPNYNLVSMYAAFAGVYFMGRIVGNTYEKKSAKVVFAIFMILAAVSVFIFGSRKSILMLILGFGYFVVGSGKINSRIKLILIGVLALIVAAIVLPDEYVDYVLSRFGGLFESKSSRLEAGDKERVDLLEYGLRFIEESPLLGHGYYSFAPMYASYRGAFLYAHNNYIELIADLGIVGLFIFYYPVYAVFKIGLKYRRYSSFISVAFVLNLLNIFGGFFIVTFIDRTIWILMAILWVGVKLNKNCYRRQNHIIIR